MLGIAALPTPEFREALLETYAVSDRMNQLILEHVDPRAWRAKPPGRDAPTIAAIFAHMHNIGRKWLRLSAPHLKLPTQPAPSAPNVGHVPRWQKAPYAARRC